MNKSIILTLLAFASAVLAYDLQIGTNHLDVSFEAVGVSPALKDFIFADLQRCYSAYGTNATISVYGEGEYAYTTEIPLVFGPYAKLNTSLPREIVTNNAGNLFLSISSSLIEKYEATISFKTNNLSAIQAADAFVDFLNTTNILGVASNQIANFVLYKNTTAQEYEDMADRRKAELYSNDFYHPSILGFYHAETGPTSPTGTNLWMLVPVNGKETREYPNFDVFPAIWHDGHWKFCSWQD